MLLLTRATLAEPEEHRLEVAGGAIATVAVAAGQLLAITDLEGGQPAALFAAALDDPGHILSPHHTRVFSNSFVLRLGMRLMSNRRRPVMVLSRDSVGRHDLLMPVTEAADATDVAETTARFRGRLASAFAARRLDLPRLPDPVNLFLDVAVLADGRLEPRGASAPAGGAVLLRVLMDLIVAIAAPLPDHALWRRAGGPGRLAVHVRNHP